MLLQFFFCHIAVLCVKQCLIGNFVYTVGGFIELFFQHRNSGLETIKIGVSLYNERLELCIKTFQLHFYIGDVLNCISY